MFEELTSVDVGLLVAVPDREPYPARATAGLPPETIDRLHAGMTLVVKVDARDPQGVLIDWVESAKRWGWLDEGGAAGPDQAAGASGRGSGLE
jgi:hypothetical protein